MNFESNKKNSVLLVDDDLDIIELMRESLEDLSFKVYTAFNGQEALNFLAKTSVDCIITDVSMPVMKGPEFIKIIHEKGNFIPFFFITAYYDYTIENLNNYKPRAIIFKPFDFQEAAILVKNHMMRL